MKYLWRLYYLIAKNPGTFSGAAQKTARIYGLKCQELKLSQIDATEWLGKADYVSKD